MKDNLKVLFIAAEALPFAKVGGLADVAGALPKALRDVGVDARLLIPRYGNIRSKDYDFHRIGNSIPVPAGPSEERVHLLQTTSDDVPVYLIWEDHYFSAREKVYGFRDDPMRFVFFSRAVIAVLKALDWTPDIIHANDWHTGPVPTWLDIYGKKEAVYKDIATLFTIHNLAYQGICGRLLLTFGRMDDVPHLPVEPPGQINWMAQGIAHADLISTVSSVYAREILQEESGMGLASLLQQREDRLFGILSGIDVERWNPDTDEALPQTFDVDSLKMRLVNKTALQRDLRLSGRVDVPLLGMVSRLDNIKGLDLLLAALEQLLDQQDVEFVLLGTGEPAYEEKFQALQARFPDNVRALIKFDERAARQIYGGVDAFVMPSRSEPSSVSVMTAMRYGAVPIVRATGGLADIVVDTDAQKDRGVGFTFEAYEERALLEAMRRAIAAYADRARWESIQRRAMEMDFSWNASAQAYVDLYQRALALHQQTS